MNIDFGVVKKYFADRGFGFVTHTFSLESRSEVFFHIKSIKKTRPQLAERLANDDAVETVYFWYETENTIKGEQVRAVVASDVISERSNSNLAIFTAKVESLWRNIDSAIPAWLYEVTLDLVGENRASELSSERDALEEQWRKDEELRRKEREALQRKEEEMRQKIAEERRLQEEIEENEFEQLVAEMTPLGLKYSNQVSHYIVRKTLGHKYRNISGIVQMEKDGNEWAFKGGFPPHIYAKLCERLGLSDQGTRARAVGFESFKDLEVRRRT